LGVLKGAPPQSHCKKTSTISRHAVQAIQGACTASFYFECFSPKMRCASFYFE
jgi:hypothetical protein